MTDIRDPVCDILVYNMAKEVDNEFTGRMTDRDKGNIERQLEPYRKKSLYNSDSYSLCLSKLLKEREILIDEIAKLSQSRYDICRITNLEVFARGLQRKPLKFSAHAWDGFVLCAKMAKLYGYGYGGSSYVSNGRFISDNVARFDAGEFLDMLDNQEDD